MTPRLPAHRVTTAHMGAAYPFQAERGLGSRGVYMGRDMKTAHKGMGITESDWDLSVKALTATLDKFKVPEKEKGEVLAAVGPLTAQIVEK